MSIKRNVKFLCVDLKGTNGIAAFIYALMTTIFVVGILLALVIAIIFGMADYSSVCAGLVLAFFILGNFGRDKKLESMEKIIQDDKITISKLYEKDKGIDYDRLNKQMKEMQDD